MKFHIGTEELDRRQRRMLLGGIFSALLVALIAYQHQHYPEDYNDALFWSVAGFVLIANLVNALRHRGYAKKVKTHELDLLEGSVRFTTQGEASELDLDQVAAMQVFRQGKRIGHVQLKLRNGRGIRLEGYEDMDGLTEALKTRLPDRQM